MKKNISIVLFTIWCVFSGLAFSINIDNSNSFLKYFGAMNLLIIIFLLLYIMQYKLFPGQHEDNEDLELDEKGESDN